MAKFNTANARAAQGKGFIESEAVATGVTFEGAPGYSRTAKSELFLLAVSEFVGENKFYETGDQRLERLTRLSREVAVGDLEWTVRFVNWLRQEANMRSVSIVVALEGAKALNDAKVPGGRALVAAALHRADEPGEALAYWFTNFGRKVPMSVKRGIADAVVRSYNEYSLGKYDAKGRGFRFGDVIDLVHPSPKDEKQSALFKYSLDRRRDSGVEVPENLEQLTARKQFLALSKTEVRNLVNSGEAADRLKAAGLTWENLSGAVEGGMDAKAWEAVIPSMGYMALLRNLRNFEQAGVSPRVLDQVAKRIADPDEVAKSRQLPMRFLSAYNATKGSLRFAFPLEQALNHSLKNVPELSGRTLILVDRSGSMFGWNPQPDKLTDADTAAIFGTALALRAENADLVEFGTNHKAVSFSKSDSILKTLDKFHGLGGTNTAAAVKAHLRKDHTRVIILTDEQASYYAGSNPTKAVPAQTPVYTWNLAGYKRGHGADGTNRYTFGGLSDAAFRTIDLVERGKAGDWPF